MDLQLRETLDGGDFVKKRNDLAIVEGFQNMPYLAMFGGNPGFITPQNRQRYQQAFDFWGNNVFANNNRTLQFNSSTEYALMTTPLNSNGRGLIEQAVKRDLQFMRTFARVGVAVVISGVDRITIAIRIVQPENLQQRDFIYIWDASKRELISQQDAESTGDLPTFGPPLDSGIFDYTFGPEFE